MTTSDLAAFWCDVAIAYNQVASDHTRAITLQSKAEGLTAIIIYDSMDDCVMVSVFAGKRELEESEGDEVAT